MSDLVSDPVGGPAIEQPSVTSAGRRPAPVVSEVAGLHVTQWPGTGPVVLGLPGLTSTGRAWTPLATAVPQARVVAPDLRGRGHSQQLQGPTGLAAHAADVVRIADELDLSDVVLVGHSMGAYLAVVAAAGLGDRVRRLVLVDGGLPPSLPRFMGPGLTRRVFRRDLRALDREWPDASTFTDAVLGKALARRPELRDELVALLAHDLGGTPGRLRARIDTTRAVADAVDTFFGTHVVPALGGLDRPTHLLAAAHGKHDRAKAFLSDAVLQAWQRRLPTLTVERVQDNHLTVLLSPRLAAAVTA